MRIRVLRIVDFIGFLLLNSFSFESYYAGPGSKRQICIYKRKSEAIPVQSGVGGIVESISH